MTNNILLVLYLVGVFYFGRARFQAGTTSSEFYLAAMVLMVGLGWPAAALVVVSDNLKQMYQRNQDL